MSDVYKESIELHKTHRGKIEITPKVHVKNYADLARVYSPGVAEISRVIAHDKNAVNTLTYRGRAIAVVSDGSAILGLGNLGPYAALPVMEGKALLFKRFADLDAVPICLNAHDADSIVQIVKALEPSFAGINLEDIRAPLCFEVERRLRAEMSIPVMHDDQHGTAIVVLAGLINALRVVKKEPSDITLVITGAGAAGISIAQLLSLYGVKNIIIVDSKGIVSSNRSDLNQEKRSILDRVNPYNKQGDLSDACVDADVFVGVSQAGILTEDMIRTMKEHPIIFALANPTPEIMPDAAFRAGAYIVATGRSDFPNQLNNALAFPGIFKGMIEYGVSQFSDNLFIKAAHALAECVDTPTTEKIIPGIFEEGLADKIAAVFADEK